MEQKNGANEALNEDAIDEYIVIVSSLYEFYMKALEITKNSLLKDLFRPSLSSTSYQMVGNLVHTPFQ